MPRFSREGRSEFLQAAALARDTQDPSPLADFLLANQDRMPQWALQEADRTIHNIAVAQEITAGQQTDLPEETQAVYSLVRYEHKPLNEGEEPIVSYATIVTRFEGEPNIDEVLANIEATLEAWSDRSLPTSAGPDVVSVWQVSTGQAGELSFPLGGSHA